jgi:GTP cyclohydrolase I
MIARVTDRTGAEHPLPSINLKTPGDVDLDAAADAVRNLLLALGEDPDREGLRDTPRRVAKAMNELMAGRFEDPGVHLKRAFAQRSDEVIMLKNIELFSMCEHHLLPFIGKAHVAYLPSDGQVVGLSKLARLVDVYAKRPQLQERLTNQVADALIEHINPLGAAVIVQAEHMCMKMRGVCKHEPVMHTFALRGVFKDNPEMRTEILTMLNAGM